MISHHSVSVFHRVFYGGFQPTIFAVPAPLGRRPTRKVGDRRTITPMQPETWPNVVDVFSVGQWSITSQSNEKLHKNGWKPMEKYKVYHVFRQLASDVFHIKLMEMNSKLCSRY